MRGQHLTAIPPGGVERVIATKYPTHHVGRHAPGFVSLQQRIEHCQAITQVLPLRPGSREYTDLEYYLTWLALVASYAAGLPAREGAKAETKKRVQLKLVGSTPSRGESVVRSYASRSRDVTTSYYMRCVNSRKEWGQRHSYSCK